MPNDMTTGQLVFTLQQEAQDFEFYPTTNEIIDALAADLEVMRNDRGYSYRGFDSVLDIGAGNGKVLQALRERCGFDTLYAIEKSPILCDQLPADVLIVGTEFEQQSLFSKHTAVTFCNPPYSAFEAWAIKIIRQSASKIVYLVIPERWQNSTSIADALRYREAECTIVGAFDFLSSEDRRARAKVHLLRVQLQCDSYGRESDDAFDRFFKEQFAHLIKKCEDSQKQEREGKQSRFSDIVVGPSYVESMVSLYLAELGKVQRNFDAVGTLDADLLKEFEISVDSIRSCLKARLSGLRSEYWEELFRNLHTVTDRLTSKSRRALLNTLQKHVHVDFTESNIRAVLVWVIKNANIYLESQLIETYQQMIETANVVKYKSNERVWVDDRWRYRNDPSVNTHFALDYRIVMQSIGGISAHWGYSELNEHAGDFIGDLLTIARNLGFNCETNHYNLTHQGRREWEPGKRMDFYGSYNGRKILLMDVKAFKNRNVHIRFAAPLILALNVEHGRLKGWLKSREEAAEELQDAQAAEFYRANKLLTASSVLMLGAPNE